MICKYCWILICCILNVSFAQKSSSDVNIISEKLLENANSIILNQEITINVKSQKSYVIKKYKKIKILNKLGVKNIDALEYYDKSSKINSSPCFIQSGTTTLFCGIPNIMFSGCNWRSIVRNDESA